MKWLWRMTAALLALLVLALAGLWGLLQRVPSLQPYEDLRWPVATAAAPSATEPSPVPRLNVRFAGVSTLVLDDGQTAVMTDGFFSRPSMLQTLLGKVQPDLQAIDRGLQRLGLATRAGAEGRVKAGALASPAPARPALGALWVVHSHYDHAMDAPAVAERTGALLLGSPSTVPVGLGWGLPADQMRAVRLREPQDVGAFRVTVLPSRHAPTGFGGGEITEPVRPPVRAGVYQAGANYSVLVEHAGRSVLIVGSAGFEPGALQGVRADVVLLGIGALGARSADYREALWREVVTTVQARRVVLIHWDDFWQPVGRALQPLPYPVDDFGASMDFLRAAGQRDGVQVRLPLQWDPMDLWADLPERVALLGPVPVAAP